MSNTFPFAAIVGQEDMKLAIIMSAIDPKIGGVLVFGDRGTGKSTAVRGLANLLPPINSVDGCPVNSSSLDETPTWSENTSKKIVEMVRKNGAKNVYFASAAPPVKYQNVYGIDMPAVTEFIANGRTVEEIGETIGADQLFYQSLDD